MNGVSWTTGFNNIDELKRACELEFDFLNSIRIPKRDMNELRFNAYSERNEIIGNRLLNIE